MPLSARGDYGDARFAGVEVDACADLEAELEVARAGGFDFLIAPLALPRDPAAEPAALRPPVARSAFLLRSSSWCGQVVGRLSAWALTEDTAPVAEQAAAAEALQAELAWAAHLSLQAVLLDCPPHGRCAGVARALLAALPGLTHTAVWVRVPLLAPALAAAEGTPAEAALLAATEPATGAASYDTWEWFHALRQLADAPPALGAVLVVGPSLPPEAHWRRWLGEPLRCVVLGTCAFLTNKRGFPVLPRAHQELVLAALAAGVQVALRGAAAHPPPAPEAGPGPLPPPPHPLQLYWDYLAFLHGRLPELGRQEALEAGYADYLQMPLQPLADNLESQTYETFEADRPKYAAYGEAVRQALLDTPSPTPAEAAAIGGGAVVVMVVGAGRGPLVAATLQASKDARRPVRIYAVEKNPCAVVHLRARAAAEGWGPSVAIVAADMRAWAAPERAHILVSELLGSFGDNELSPECLDGAQRFLEPTGISIPASYTSFLAPVTAAKLAADVRAHGDLAHAETPYVVKLRRVAALAPTRPVFTFSHPNRAPEVDNRRHVALEFARAADAPAALVHGFAGYFEAVLYKEVTLSTHPPSHTPAMRSWFPIFFPLRAPVYVPAGQPVAAQMWRCCSASKVWYEWAVTAPQPSPVHNPGGRSYFVGL